MAWGGHGVSRGRTVWATARPRHWPSSGYPSELLIEGFVTLFAGLTTVGLDPSYESLKRALKHHSLKPA